LGNDLNLRKIAIAVFNKYPLGEDKAAHSRAVGECAERIINHMRKKEIRVDHEVVYAAAILHDIGIAKSPYKSQAEEEMNPWPEHAVEGARIALEEGLPRSVAEAIQAHEQIGFNRNEIEELHLAPPVVGETWGSDAAEAKVVAAADQVVYIVRHMGLDIWNDNTAIIRGNFSYLDTLYRQRTGGGVSQYHPILKRIVERTKEILPFVKPVDVPPA
jgi:putative nucleotidyltransferase with HDIG domain